MFIAQNMHLTLSRLFPSLYERVPNSFHGETPRGLPPGYLESNSRRTGRETHFPKGDE